MSRYNLSVYLLLTSTLLFGSFRGKAMTTGLPACDRSSCCESAEAALSAQLLKDILQGAMDAWPVPVTYTYGNLRSAYNHGSLTIAPVSNPAPHVTPGTAYLVTYDGITVCVIIPA